MLSQLSVKLVAASAFASACLATNFKVGVISDSHFNEIYNAYSSIDHCMDPGHSGEAAAPLGRYDCDPSSTLLDYMYTRHAQVFGQMDVLLVPGDSAAHKVAERHPGDDDSLAHYEAVKANLAATAAKLQEYFPQTLILPTFGNNDGRVHDDAIDETDKPDYYSFVYDVWFTQHAPNVAKLDLPSIYETFMLAGYYRADLTDKITLLSTNSMYMDAAAQETYNGEGSLITSWLENQLALAYAEDRKVIIMDHVYAGTRWHAEKMWFDDYNSEYFRVLRAYHEQVIIEVVGHDHYADLRYHSSYHVADLEDTSEKFDFHNLLVAPGVTPYDNSNPGVAKFEITEDLVPTALEMEFLGLEATFGFDSVAYDDIEWWHVNWSTMWGISDITPTEISEFRKRLEADQDYALNYLVSKLGFNYQDPVQYQQGIDVLTDADLVTTSKHKTGEYICQMHKSITPDEYTECCDGNYLATKEFLQ